MVYLIAAEMVVGDVGFGYRIRLQSKLLNMSVVYPYLAMLAAFGFGMDSLAAMAPPHAGVPGMKPHATETPRHDVALECRGVHHWFGRKRVLGDVNLKRAARPVPLAGRPQRLRQIHPPARHRRHASRPGRARSSCSGDGAASVAERGPRPRTRPRHRLSAVLPVPVSHRERERGLRVLMLDQTCIGFRFFALPGWRRQRKRTSNRPRRCSRR